MSVLLAVFTTTGGRQVFVREMLGDAYDSQAEHFLHGDVNVDGDAIRHEVMVVNGQSRMYYGPFPALLRIPLNFVYHAGRGNWSRLSGLCAGIIVVAAFAALLADSLRTSTLSARNQAWFGSVCVAGIGFASPLLLLLGNLSIYNEAVIWGFAGSVAALFFANRARTATGSSLIGYLLGFSISGGAALLSRSTFGVPFLLTAPLLLLPWRERSRVKLWAATLLPLGISLLFYLALSHARFGSWSGIGWTNYINPVHRDFVEKHGMFNLSRLGYGFSDYFSLHFPRIISQAPFLSGERHPVPNAPSYSLPFSENYVSILWCSAWLVFGAIIGIFYLFRQNRSDLFKRCMAAALLVEFVLILIHFALAQRYSADLYPFLIFCFIVFVGGGGIALARTRYVIAALVVFSIAVNSATTISWLVDADQNVPAETRAAWNKFLGRQR